VAGSQRQALRTLRFLSRRSAAAATHELLQTQASRNKSASEVSANGAQSKSSKRVTVSLPDRIGAQPIVRLAVSLMAKPYGGSVVAAAMGLVALTLATAALVFGFDWVRSWKVIGFPGALPPFSDFHVVTENAARCSDASISEYPYIHARCDPWHQIYNYPPIWLMLGKLGINGSHTAAMAMLIELPALALFALLLRGRSVRCGLLALPLMLSPSVVLGFERGNIDILEWILVCAAALVYSDDNKPRAGICLVILWIAVAIKFLGVFCCTLAIRLRSASVIVSVLLVIFALLYLYSLSDVLPMIRAITPISPYVSYGYIILFDRLEFLYGPRLGVDLSGLTGSPIPLVAVALVLVAAAAWAVAIWRRGRAQCMLDQGSDGIAFLFGSGIYCGSFLLLGSNYSYRLMFLLLCLPQLFDWIEGPDADASSKRLSYLLLGSCVISMWLKFHPEKTLHVNQVTDWVLFAALAMLAVLNALYAFGDYAGRSGVRVLERTS